MEYRPDDLAGTVVGRSVYQRALLRPATAIVGALAMLGMLVGCGGPTPPSAGVVSTASGAPAPVPTASPAATPPAATGSQATAAATGPALAPTTTGAATSTSPPAAAVTTASTIDSSAATTDLLGFILAQASSTAPTSTPEATLESGMRVDVGGYALWIQCRGQGSPPVVLDAGASSGASSWSRVQPGVAQFARVCAYDRAGRGKSDQVPNPTTSRQQVQDLRTLLTNVRLGGPYVLVGHSFGGMNMELYARLYPAEAVGLVLVDAVHEDQYLDPAFRAQYGDVLGGVKLIESAQQVRAAPPLPNIPLIVLAHGLPDSSLLVTEERWSGWQHDLAARAPRGKVVVADRSGHNIPQDQPDLVIASIRQVVGEARR